MQSGHGGHWGLRAWEWWDLVHTGKGHPVERMGWVGVRAGAPLEPQCERPRAPSEVMGSRVGRTGGPGGGWVPCPAGSRLAPREAGTRIAGWRGDKAQSTPEGFSGPTFHERTWKYLVWPGQRPGLPVPAVLRPPRDHQRAPAGHRYGRAAAPRP